MDKLTEAEFCQRFTVELVRLAGETYGGGHSTADYAKETAPTYYIDECFRRDGPEACAEANFDCWE